MFSWTRALSALLINWNWLTMSLAHWRRQISMSIRSFSLTSRSPRDLAMFSCVNFTHDTGSDTLHVNQSVRQSITYLSLPVHYTASRSLDHPKHLVKTTARPEEGFKKHRSLGFQKYLKKISKVQNLCFSFFGEILYKSYLISYFSCDLWVLL